MTKDTFKLTTLGLLVASVPAFAFAELSLGTHAGLTEAEIRAALEEQGAQVLEIEIESDEIEVEYLLNGVEYEAELDPDTGDIIALEIEDDDDDDDGEDDDEYEDDDHDDDDDEEDEDDD